MKMSLKKEVEGVRFSEIHQGEAFKEGGNVYIKTDNMKYNACRLYNGVLVYLDNTRNVSRLTYATIHFHPS